MRAAECDSEHTNVARRGAVVGLLAAAALLTFGRSGARAAARIRLAQARQRPVRIAIADFAGASAFAAEPAADIVATIRADLGGTGAAELDILDPATYGEAAPDIDTPPAFAHWRALGADALIVGRVAGQPDGRLRVEFRLWDVVAGQQLFGASYHVQAENWRTLAHIIAGAIYQRLTGQPREFQ